MARELAERRGSSDSAGPATAEASPSGPFWEQLQSIFTHCPNIPTREDSSTQAAYDERDLLKNVYTSNGFAAHVRNEFATKVIPYIDNNFPTRDAAFDKYAIAECFTGSKRKVLNHDRLGKLLAAAQYSQGNYLWIYSPAFVLTGGHKGMTRQGFHSLIEELTSKPSHPRETPPPAR